MANKYEKFRSYQDMRDTGYTEKQILKDINDAKDSMFATVPDEALCFLVATNLHVITPKPNISCFTTNSTYTLSQLNNISDGTIVNVKGMIAQIYNDSGHSSVILTDFKTSIRCILFDNSIKLLKDKNLNIGDRVKFKNVIVRNYENRKEVKGFNNTTLIKLKYKHYKINR